MTTAYTPPFAAKGSQRWLQIAVNLKPELLNVPIREAAGLGPSVDIKWLSPLASQKFVEYCDGSTFEQLGVQLAKRPLEDFWPSRGPRWDGLARSTTGDVFLVEAKAHIGEMVSGASRATEPALTKITESLRAVQRAIAPGADAVNWTGTFYQYANRLAHLHLLREQNGIPAHLVFVYFLNDEKVKGPKVPEAYEGATHVIEHYLGIRQSKISRFVHKIYVEVNELKALVPDEALQPTSDTVAARVD